MASETNTTGKWHSKHFQTALILQVVVGVFLAATTIGAVGLLKNTANNELFGWLGLSSFGIGVGAGALGLLVIALTADFLWLLFFILWILRRKMHLEKTNKTLRLP